MNHFALSGYKAFMNQKITTSFSWRFVPFCVLALLSLGLTMASRLEAQSPQSKSGTVIYAMDNLADLTTKNDPQVFVPKRITVTRQRKIDFILYYFTVPVTEEQMQKTDASADEMQFLFAYLGYHPSFPLEVPKGVREQRIKVGGLTARNFVWKNKDGNFCRETLIDTGQSLSPGTVTAKLHFSYKALSPAEAKVSDAIIASLKLSTNVKNP